MYTDEIITCSKLPADILDDLKAVQDYLRDKLYGYRVVSVEGEVNCTFYKL